MTDHPIDVARLEKTREALRTAIAEAGTGSVDTQALLDVLSDGPQVVSELRLMSGMEAPAFNKALETALATGLIEVVGADDGAKVSLNETGRLVATFQ